MIFPVHHLRIGADHVGFLIFFQEKLKKINILPKNLTHLNDIANGNIAFIILLKHLNFFLKLF